MSGLVPLQPLSDLSTPVGRNQLQESLFLQANAIRLLREELDKVKDADKIVRPVPIENFPVAAGQIYTGEEGGEIGDITWRAVNSAPVGMLACDGSEYSQTTYADLYAVIDTTFNTGGETAGHFRVPNMKGRAAVGIGQCSGGTPLTWALGDLAGDDRLHAHTHDLGNHTHNFDHNHKVDTYSGGGSGSLEVSGVSPSSTFLGQKFTTTDGGNTAGPSSNTSGSTGSGTGDNVQPSIGLAPFIRFRLGPTDTIQTLPISWGSLNAQWELDTLKNFPKSAVSNLHSVITVGDLPEAVVRVSAVGGTQSGSTGTANKIVGVMRVPYNFRGWRTNALVIRTKVLSTGITTNESCTVTLKVSDPLNAGAYLPSTYSRTISESSGSIDDGGYVDATLTAEDLGRTWKPGYLFRFELIFNHPKTFTTAALDVGLLQLNWK